MTNWKLSHLINKDKEIIKQGCRLVYLVKEIEEKQGVFVLGKEKNSKRVGNKCN